MVQDAPSANTEFPTMACSRLIMARAKAWSSTEVRLVRVPMALPSAEVPGAGREKLGQVEGGSDPPSLRIPSARASGRSFGGLAVAKTQRWRLTWPTLRRREMTSWPM